MPRLDQQHDSGIHKGISSWKRSFGGQKTGAAGTATTAVGTSVSATGGAGKIKTAAESAPVAPDTAATASTGTATGTTSSFQNPRETRLEHLSSSSASRRVGDGAYESSSTLEPATSRAGKMRFHLLNPMALLARRRSSTPFNPRPEDINIGKLTLPALPDDYDPRIRGKLFHDFSVPRARPTPFTSNSSSSGNTSASPHHPGYSGGSRELGSSSYHAEEGYFSDSCAQGSRRDRQIEHRPVFRENFDDEITGSGGDRLSRSQHQQQNQQPEEGVLQQDGSLHPVPVFARNLPATLPSSSPSKPEPEHDQGHVRDNSAGAGSREETPAPKAAIRSRQSTVREAQGPAQAPSSLPRHLTSSASRFSFDMAGGDSASQERLLEEKHKQKEAARRQKAQEEQQNTNTKMGHFDDFDDDEFDYDAMMDDDGLEERIPGVNADADEDDDREIAGIEDGTFDTRHPLTAKTTFLLSPSSSNGISSPQAGGTSSSAYGSDLLLAKSMATPPTVLSPLITDLSQLSLQQTPQPKLETTINGGYDDDDLYYDDGLFGDLPEDMQDSHFDESVFDDETSHLYKRRSDVNKPLPVIPESQRSVSGQEGNTQWPARETKDTHASALAPQLDDLRTEPLRLSVRGLSHGSQHGTMEEYHDALAQAANEAALNGRFQRDDSDNESHNNGTPDEIAKDEEQEAESTDESHPNLTNGQSRHTSKTSQNIDTVAFDQVFDDFAFYDDDIADLEDDPMIAAANAEVLENDDEGIYGQEFGFYAHSHPHCDEERVFGGYFGSMGMSGIKRSHSARANFQEPSLTPITERSEWSTRNSIISLGPNGSGSGSGNNNNCSNNPMASPPLSQLIDMASTYEEDLSLSALMRLRRGAFGGSNGSLRSNSTSQTGQSPQSPCAPQGSFANFQNVLSPGGMSPAPLWAENHHLHHYSPNGLGMIEPPAPLMRLRSTERPLSMSLDSSLTSTNPATATATATTTTTPPVTRSPEMIRRHVRSSSATGSISYVKETDEAGGNCWVLERRRTGEDGEGEVVEREVMSAGRI